MPNRDSANILIIRGAHNEVFIFLLQILLQIHAIYGKFLLQYGR